LVSPQTAYEREIETRALQNRNHTQGWLDSFFDCLYS
jgi:hypothetical protein